MYLLIGRWPGDLLPERLARRQMVSNVDRTQVNGAVAKTRAQDFRLAQEEEWIAGNIYKKGWPLKLLFTAGRPLVPACAFGFGLCCPKPRTKINRELHDPEHGGL